MAKVPPRNPNYSAADLWPPGSQGVEFPPAAFHPVYLGNFLCQQYSELVPRVQQYFASKGLLVRMVFSRGADTDPFRAYQDKTKLYDCLVYFTRPEDAQDAIKYLHRDKYFGHRLNIFPGREPELIIPERSVGYDIPVKMLHWPSYIIVEHIKRTTYANIRNVKRLGADRIIVEYVNAHQREKALRLDRYFMPNSLVGQVISHQHFLEQDVMEEIRYRIANTPFMTMGPERCILDELCAGRIPKVPKKWAKNCSKPNLKPYLNPFIAHEPRVQLQIAKAVQQNFGLVCDFVASLSQTPDPELQQQIRMFYQGVANSGRKRRIGLRNSLIKSYGYFNGRDIFQATTKKK